jgi:hypothetical protein
MQHKFKPSCCDTGLGRFIHANFLTIGYLAWQGYLSQGRGAVVYEADADPVIMGEVIDQTRYHWWFAPQTQVWPPRLSVEADAATVLVKAVSDYIADQEIVILRINHGVVDISLLQNLKIAPSVCHQQVVNRWAEFQPDLMPLSW